MKTIRPLLLFAGKFFVIYIALIVLANTTGLDKAYRNFYVKTCSALYQNIYENADIKCEPLEDSRDGSDIVFTFANKQDIEKATQEAKQTGKVSTTIKGFKWFFDSYRVDLMFLLFLLALVLSYSSDWKHMLKGLGLGLVFYYVISLSLLAGRLLFQFHQNESVFPEYHLSGFGEQFISTATNMHTEGMFFIVLLIWGLVMVRRKDFDRLKNIMT